jgi:hydroxyacylglutathione hydrolase
LGFFFFWRFRYADHVVVAVQQRTALGLADLPVIGGKSCEAVTSTPADGEGFPLGDIKVKGLYTPCHTQDSICWFMQDGDDKVVFTGDTLFHGGKSLFVRRRRRQQQQETSDRPLI